MKNEHEEPSSLTTIDYLASMNEVESVCLNCFENGVTKFLPTHIPYFRDIIISAFECPHCGNRNSQLFNATAIADHGTRFELSVSSVKDLSRQLVVSEHCRLSLLEIDFAVDPSGDGYLTTVEGLLGRWLEGIEAMLACEELKDQKVRLLELFERMTKFHSASEPFKLVVDDPSGSSFVERFDLSDAAITETRYRRTSEQHAQLGLAVESAPAKDALPTELDPSLYCFTDSCPGCGVMCETRMHPVDIPHFREVIIMATICDRCGYKSSEVKSGGPVQPRGRRITLKLESIEDLSRDILKSESCSLRIPDIELELGTGTLGGRFTTIEGLLDQVKEELINKVPFCIGDSADQERKSHLDKLVTALDDIIEGRRFCHIIIDDPLGSSYVQSLYAPDPDPQILEEEYERSFEENEEFGLNDIKVENYA
jgi:zinc finger protein